MASSSCALGRQGNQNAAALSPEEGIVKLLERTKYTFVQENGQRRYGPPPNWRSEPPPRGCEVFVGKIPRDCFEDELIPVFEKIGPIYMFRLMMEFNGSNRGYGFCVYTNREDTKRAVQELDNYEIRKGKTIGVCFSVDNCRLFVGGIPKNKTRDEILTEMKRVTEGVKDVISYPSVNDKTKNRGFAFVEYESHKAAAMARRKLIPGRIQLWGQQIAVDWAEPEREVNEDIMSKVKILYVRNLMVTTSEESLREHFIRVAGGDPNCVERVKKINDYAFIHFKEREQAAKCLQALNDTTLEGSRIEVTWAKPVDKNEATARQQSTRTSSKLINELVLGKDLSVTNPLNPATMVAAGGLLPPLDASLPYILSSVGQQALAPDLLSVNPAAVSAIGAAINFSNANTRSNGTRSGRRNAAGSRSAGMQRDRKHPIEKQQQRQMNPFNCYEILEELARQGEWGSPIYSALPVDLIDPTTGGKLQFFMGQVLLPNLRLQYTAPRYYNCPEEAKLGACEAAILNIQYNLMMTTDAITGNYMLPVGSNVTTTPAFLPIALQNATPTAGNTLSLLQTQANGSTQPNLSTQATLALNSPVVLPECTSNLTVNGGYDYSPQLFSSSLTAASLVNPYTNPSAYLVDSNTVLMGSNGQLPALPTVVTMPQTSVNGPTELIHQVSMGQSNQLSASQVPQSGLYRLNLSVHTGPPPPTQLNSAAQNQATLLSVLTPNQTQSVGPGHSNNPCPNGPVSAAQSMPVTGTGLSVHVPTAV